MTDLPEQMDIDSEGGAGSVPKPEEKQPIGREPCPEHGPHPEELRGSQFSSQEDSHDSRETPSQLGQPSTNAIPSDSGASRQVKSSPIDSTTFSSPSSPRKPESNRGPTDDRKSKSPNDQRSSNRKSASDRYTKSLEAKIELLNSERVANRSDVRQLELNLTQYKAKLAELKSNIELLSSERVANRNDIKRLESNLAQCKAKLAEYKSHIELLNSESVADRNEIKQLKLSLAQSEERNRTMKLAITKMRPSNSSVVTDTQISKDYQYVIEQLKDWTLSHFRDTNPSMKHIKKTIENFGLRFNTGDTASIAEATYKHFKEDVKLRRFLVIGMLVIRYLDEHIFRQFLFGLNEAEERYFCSMIKLFEATSTPKEIEFWCSNTAELLIATETHKHKVEEQKRVLVMQIESLLAGIIPQDGDAKERLEELQLVVGQAADLALTLSVQRARYFLYSPPPGSLFSTFVDPAENNGDSGPERSGRGEGSSSKAPEGIIELTVYPGLAKEGNEDGEKYNEVTPIYNAKALQKIPEKSIPEVLWDKLNPYGGKSEKPPKDKQKTTE